MASPDFLRAHEALSAGRVVAAATDTLIGLLVDAESEAALDGLASLKERKEGQAFALIAPSLAQVEERFLLSDAARKLANAYWPGPLTLVLKPRGDMDERLQLHGKIGVRVPAPCDAHALAAALGRCVTATSANFSGKQAPSHTKDLDPALRRALDASGGMVLPGAGPGGPPSTLVDVSEGVRVLRAGAIALPD